jgi:paired amphipathic helix protein Sin3a
LNRKELGPDKPPGSRRHTPHAEFLKLLHLFGAGIVCKVDLLFLIKTLFTQGHAPKSGSGGANNTQVAHDASILLKEFEELMIERGPYAQQETSKMAKSKYGSVTSKEFDAPTIKEDTDNLVENPSYTPYPSDYPYEKFHTFSGQTEEDASVLNTKMLCVGVHRKVNRLMNSPEEYDGIEHRKNKYERAMAKIEDERFEVDMAIERNSSAVRQVEPLAQEVSNLREQEEKDSQPIGRLNYKLRPRSLHSNHVGAIARLYGDRGDEILHHLMRNPVAVLPIVFKRLREKDTEWRRVKTEMSKQWRIAAEANFEASLDVLCHFYRRQIEHSIKPDELIDVRY